MNAWDMWTWPWSATLEIWRRSMDFARAAPESPVAVDEPAEPEWTTPHREIIEIAALRLHDFSRAKISPPALIVAPFALHDAMVADLASGHSLIEALHANGCSRVYLVEWRSATAATRLHTIDTQLASLNVAVDDIGAPVDLIGLCQGGWLSLVYAARFPTKVRRLVLAGAPVDLAAARSSLSIAVNAMSDVVIDELTRLGDGLVLGRHMAPLWPRAFDPKSHVIDSLQIASPSATEHERQAVERFARWDRRTLDLPGPYYRQIFDWLYRENRLATGKFSALGQIINLRNLHCPLYLLAGEQDVIVPPAQVFAAAALVGAREGDIETALAPCTHLALFMGRRTLATAWPRIAQWLLK